jgi:ABC-type antimicrobial peptide transport system permease subunit
MFRNYLKTALRNLSRNKTYTAINIFGLAIGIAVCLVIFIIIRFETSFDEYHSKKDRIYRIITEFHDARGTNTNAGIPYPLPTALRNDFPQLEKVTSILSINNDQIEIPGENGAILKKFKEANGVFYAEPEFFDIFDFKWLSGNASSLGQPNNAVLTRSTAEKYFGDWKQAVGKMIMRNNKKELTVTGIIEDVPANTDFQFKVIGSYRSLRYATSTDWVSVSSNMGCYVLLPQNYPAEKLSSQLPAFIKKYKPQEYSKDGVKLQSLSKVHFDTEAGNFLNRAISKELIRALIFIALFILIIACVNFINLSTALAVNRSKEVGVRKVLGSNKAQLRFQFISETALIVTAALAFSVLITLISLPLIKSILELPLSDNIFSDPAIALLLLALMPVVVILSGFYPAIILSRFNPITALKSKVAGRSSRGITIRKGLVIVQFVIAQALIIGTLVIVLQMNYFNSKSMGFDKEAVISVAFPNDSTGLSKTGYLKDELSRTEGIDKFSFSLASPAESGNWYSDFKFDHSDKTTNFSANLKWADSNYLNTYKLDLVAGRNLRQSDTVNEFLVNETLLKMLGVTKPENAINKQIDLWNGRFIANIVGVLKDFHSTSLQQEIPALIIASNKEEYALVGIKLKQGDIKSTINRIEKIWSRVYPEYVFEYQFMDEKIAAFYQQENKLSHLYKIFAAIAIILSCLGLYGLASFMAVQRIKEVGIRKVLGASVQNVIYLFSKEFIILISIAFIIAASVSWYFMDKWLQGYVYRIQLSWWIFLAGGLISLLIALLTVSSQAVKAAITNPVKNLRTE